MPATATYRPRIGITMDVGQPDDSRKTLELPADYTQAIFRNGGIPVPLPLTHDPEIRREMVDGLDGLLVPGGADLDPKLYAQPIHPETKLTDPDRTDFDLAILSLAEQRQLPTLGICLGCQTMNVQRRGTLHQHLPDSPPPHSTPESKLEHRDPGDRSNEHDVAIRPNTHLAQSLQTENLAANSRHHQGIAKVGHGLVASAYAPDGVVEAVEDPSLPFWIAVQWHPENLANTPHDKLFQALIAAARNYHNRRA